MFKLFFICTALLTVSCVASDAFPPHFADDAAFHTYLFSRPDVQKALAAKCRGGKPQLTEQEVRAVSKERAGWIRDNLSATSPIHMLIRLAGDTTLNNITIGDLLLAVIAAQKEKKKKKKCGCCPWFK